MSLYGVTTQFSMNHPVVDLAGKLDLLYDALVTYSPEFHSVDIAMHDASSFDVLIGVTVPPGFEQSFAGGLVEDALDAAFATAFVGPAEHDSTQVNVEAFA